MDICFYSRNNTELKKNQFLDKLKDTGNTICFDVLVFYVLVLMWRQYDCCIETVQVMFKLICEDSEQRYHGNLDSALWSFKRSHNSRTTVYFLRTKNLKLRFFMWSYHGAIWSLYKKTTSVTLFCTHR